MPTVLLMLSEQTEGMTDVTPMLLFLGKFLIAFGLITIVGFLTPKLAEKIDRIREQHKQKHPDDPSAQLVRGIYDLPPKHAPTERSEEACTEKDAES